MSALHNAYEREALVARVMAKVLDPAPESHWGVFEDLDHHLQNHLQAHQCITTPWSRWSSNNSQGEATPKVSSALQGATLRLLRDKGALEYALHMAAAHLPLGAPLYVYGHNDEGIKSAHKRMTPLFDRVTTVLTKHHCRVFVGFRNEQPAQATLAEWQQESEHPFGQEGSWVSYPGVFAKGKLDAATAMLIETLPKDLAGEELLDFACGIGPIAWQLVQRGAASVEMLDADAVAVAAAKLNVPEAKGYVSDGWARSSGSKYHRIVSNPPIHRGKLEDYTALEELINKAPGRLHPGGTLCLVVQRRVRIEERLAKHFGEVKILAQDSRFTVYQATGEAT